MLGFLTVAFDSIYALVFVITISGTDIGNVNNNNNEAKEKKNVACVCICAFCMEKCSACLSKQHTNQNKKDEKKKGCTETSVCYIS